MEMKFDGPGWMANFFEPRPALIKYRRGKVNTELFGRLEACWDVAQPWRENYRLQGWMKTQIPGDASSVAVANGLIPDPLLGRNADGSKWINEKEWCFRKEFHVPSSWSSLEVELEALGLDYEAEIYLNGQLLGRHEGMFVPFHARVHHILSWREKNVLLIRLMPLPYATPDHYQKRIPERAYHLRSQVSVGWDTGRSVQSPAIWDSVRLVAWKQARLTNAWVRMLRGSEGRQVTARVEFDLEAPDLDVQTVVWTVRRSDTGAKVASGCGNKPGQSANGSFGFSIRIPEARLWWSVGHGDPALYDLRLEVNGRTWKAVLERRFGLRQVEWHRVSPAPGSPHTLQCVVNKVPVFLQGMCWVPPDLRFSQISDKRYERLLELAKKASFNLIRVWGGGLVEKSAFYDICDEMGLLVWQEFPLACANYPSDEVSLTKREMEARSVIQRLRGHACLALWCGGNEMLSYGMSPRAPLLKQYEQLVSTLHPGSTFRHVSPVEGGEEGHGPWGMFSHAYWNTHAYALASEVGCPALAVPRSLARMIPKGEMHPRPSGPQGFEARDFGPSFGYHFAFLVEDDPPPPMDWQWVSYPGMTWHGYRSILGHTRHLLPKTLTELSFMSQLIQADSLSYVFDEYRRRWPANAGLALWQFNESWPALLYSIVDFYGVPKHAYYALKKSCQTVQLSVRDQSNRLSSEHLNTEVWATNVGPSSAAITEGTARLWGWDGKLYDEVAFQGVVLKNSSIKIKTANFSVPDQKSLILRIEATLNEEKCLRREAFYWAKNDPRAWAHRDIKPQVHVRSLKDRFEFKIHNPGGCFLGGVYLEVDDKTDLWSDNFLLLAPGETRRISLGSHSASSRKWSLKSWPGWTCQGLISQKNR